MSDCTQCDDLLATVRVLNAEVARLYRELGESESARDALRNRLDSRRTEDDNVREDLHTHKEARRIAECERDDAQAQLKKFISLDFKALNDCMKYRDEAEAESARLRKALEAVREELLEDSEDCDCPPEWPRCVSCRVRLNIQAQLKKEK